MAKGVELASAYISLSVTTDGIPGQIKKALNGSDADVRRAGTRMGTAYSSAMGVSAASGMTAQGKGAASKFNQGFQSEAEARGARVGTVVGTVIGKSIGGAISLGIKASAGLAAAAVGGLGVTLFKGFDRYKSLDATSKRLGQMGKTGEQVKAIIGDINSVVEGTPIALDAAAGAATKFLQGGVKEGKDLKQVLTAIADAAGSSGQDFGELSTIFGQVMNKGKLQAEEMMQFNERNINVQALLRDEFGLTGDQLEQMSKDGQISFGMLLQAVEGGVGGAAKAAGDSIDGALSKMQTAVARIGSNFLSAIFGDPLDTTQGPGGMANAINNVTEKLNGVNTWVTTHQGEIKQFFTDAADTAKDVATAVKNVGSFLNEHKEILVASAAIWTGWKAISAVAGLVASLKTVSSLLKVTLPASAATGAAGISAALAPAAALAATIMAVTDGKPQDYVGGGPKSPKAAADNQDWGRVLFGDAANWPGEVRDMFNGDQGPNIPGGGGPGAQQQRRGGATAQNPLDIFAPTGPGSANPVMPSGGSPREFAHQSMMPYWEKQGFTVGDHEADQYGEHQNGALDIMIPNLEAGQRVLQQALQDPNVYGAIFNGQSYGYGRGMTPQPYSGPNPHTDHVHVWYKPQGMASGGAARGPGGPTGDKIPAMLSNNEHVFTADDVAAMGGQGGVYAFRNALHRSGGGSIQWMDFIKQGSSGGGADFKGPGVGDIGKRIESPLKPRNPIWGDRPDGTILGPNYKPRGPGKKVDLVFPWWMFPGKNRSPGTPGERSPWPTLGFAEGGAVDPNLLLQMLAGQSQHGQAQGMPIGPVHGQMPEDEQGLPNIATEGYIPAGAGYSGKTGGGLAGSLLNMGAEAINGLIDQAVSAAAAGVGVAAMGTPGAAQGAAAAMGIGADIAKRGVQWAAEMGGIGIGAITEILTPFGAPRWLSDVDATSFIPQQRPSLGSGPSATGTPQMVEDYQHPGQMRPWTAEGQDAAIDWFHREAGVPTEPAGTTPGGTPPPEQPASIAPQPAAPNMNDPMSFLKMFGIFDHGGVLRPNSAAINLSNRPEAVLNQSQWKAMEANASGGGGSRRNGPLVHIDSVTGMNPDDVAREIGTRTRRAARQYSVRP